VQWLLLALAAAACQFAITIRLTLWQVRGTPVSYAVFQVLQALTNAATSLILIFGAQRAWQGRALGQLTAAVAFGGAAVVFLARDRSLAWPGPHWKEHAGEALRFGVPLLPHVLGALLIASTDRLMIVNLLDVSQAGVYMAAMQLGQVLGLLTESFNKAYAPWLMRHLSQPAHAMAPRLVRGTYLYFAVVIALALVAGALAPWVVPALLGERFAATAGLLVYIATGFAFGGCYYMVTNYVFYAGKTAWLSAVTLVGGTCNAVFMFVLIQRSGLVGAAQAFMLSQFINFAATWWLACKAHPMPWLPWSRASRLSKPA
jgi:O-antigen/teichoic acid export membrane protein